MLNGSRKLRAMSYFKKYKFDKSLGMRTFQNRIAVFIVLLIFGFLAGRGQIEH